MMMVRLTAISLGCVIAAIAVGYWIMGSREDPTARFERVFNAEISELMMVLSAPDGTVTDSILATSDSPHQISISGRYSGPSRREFDKLARVNNLFQLTLHRLGRENEVLWMSAPGRIDLDKDGGFRFICRFMIPADAKPGPCQLTCDYNRRRLAVWQIQVNR